MRIALVGSSIHGDLLSPNDKDIAVECKTIRELRNVVLLLGGETYTFNKYSKQAYAILRNGNLNHIVFYGFTIEDYVESMDMDIVHGYKNLITKELVLFNNAKKALKTKTISYLPRTKLTHLFVDYEDTLFDDYGNKVLERIKKYCHKLPVGWKFNFTKR